MKTRLRSLLVAGGFALGASIAVAQEYPDRDKPDKPGHKTGAGTQADLKYDGNFYGCRSSKVIGMTVKNSAGERLGEIKDVAVDPQSGEIAYAALSFGGFLDIGDKLFAIPWRSLQFDKGKENEVVLDIDKSQLKESAGFNEDNWPKMANESLATGTGERVGDKAGRSQEGQMGARPHEIARLSKIVGKNVQSTTADDKKIATIDDVVIDSREQQLAYAVLSVGGLAGMGDKLISIPWEKLDVTSDPDDKVVVRLNMTEEELKQGPQFARNDWPKADDKVHLIEVYVFYDADPYWEGSRRVSLGGDMP
jgi:sporulation protein YlmC with PRC-barrel domain